LAAWASSNITAGSDTTAILLRAIFYNLLKSPASLDRLRREIHAAGLPALVPWSRARAELPYLDAVVKEATRMHPSFGLPYERVVPGPEPAVVCGKVLPPGTIVGMSAWVVGRDRDLYGQDADEWRPERWLDEEGLDEEHRKKMEAGLLAVSIRLLFIS
jgi:cytochrome P450